VKYKNQYKEGDVLGDFGVVFLKELEPRKREGTTDKRQALFLCQCGKEFITDPNYVKTNHTKSCGCYRQKRVIEVIQKHNGKGTRLYSIWRGMRSRCRYKSTDFYEIYGGRGIKVCDEWQESFIPFQKWALDNGYTDTLQIDRIDSDGDYTPENCRWVTNAENMQNTRLIRVNNKTGFRGIKPTKNVCKYETGLKMNRVSYYLGTYTTPQEAAQAYDIGVLLLEGLHPRNFPEFSLEDYDQEIVKFIKNRLKEIDNEK
jgi:hypothetical protein